jgi:hypothetical protein
MGQNFLQKSTLCGTNWDGGRLRDGTGIRNVRMELAALYAEST